MKPAARRPAKSGGQAYPRITSSHRTGDALDSVDYGGEGGMTLRQHHAALAMQALIARTPLLAGLVEKTIAHQAFLMADAMISTGEKS